MSGRSVARVAASAGAACALAAAGQASGAARAREARSQRVHDSGKLTYRSVAASSIVDEGTLSGTLPGKARVEFIYSGSPRVTARFTIRAGGGSIDGEAHCELKDPTSLTPSFSGALSITGGSGRYRHARGRGELYGVFHRRGYEISMQAQGELSY